MYDHIFYHGSSEEMFKGDVLVPQTNGYVQLKWDSELEQLFEQERPSKYISRNKAVFLANSSDDIDALGGYTDFIFTVGLEDDDYITCDLAWYTQAEAHLENNELEKAIECARSYWNGELFHIAAESCLEVLVNSAIIIDVEEYEDD